MMVTVGKIEIDIEGHGKSSFDTSFGNIYLTIHKETGKKHIIMMAQSDIIFLEDGSGFGNMTYMPKDEKDFLSKKHIMLKDLTGKVEITFSTMEA